MTTAVRGDGSDLGAPPALAHHGPLDVPRPPSGGSACSAVVRSRVTWLAPPPDGRPHPPRVAFAVGRAAGGAVVRNRIRRRLRAALRDIQGR